MKLSIGIVGLPNVGKSTLFQILTKKQVNIANYPFTTIDPNIGIVAVPDERLEKIAHLSHSQRVIPAVVEFYDIAGLVKNAYQGEGLGNQFLSHIRETKAILHLVRCFKNNEIVHIEGSIDPERDIEIVELELILKDLETVEKRLKKAESEAKSGKKELIERKNKIEELKNILEKGELLFPHKDYLEKYQEIIKELNLLTAKPQLFLLNGQEKEVDQKVLKKIESLKADYLIVNLKEALDVSEVIKKAYQILNLISFFTIGENETRAWTIVKGTKAPEAGGLIHSDFEKKFIKAEVIEWDKLILAGSWAEARQKGWLKLEGKDYIVKDGDVIFFRHG